MASNETKVTVLVSLYLTPESGKVNGQPTDKEKFYVPEDKEVHKELHRFNYYYTSQTLPQFTKSPGVKAWSKFRSKLCTNK